MLQTLFWMILVLVPDPPVSPKIKGDVILVEGFAELTVPGAKPSDVIWRVSPKPIKKSIIQGVLVFTGLPGVTYEAEATVVNWELKQFTQVFQEVTFAGAPNPGPGPAPLDPLVTKFKAAIAADPDKTLIPKFLTLYDKMLETGGLIDKASTYGEWDSSSSAYATSLGLSNKAKLYQSEAASFAREKLPWREASATPIDKALVKQVFTQIRNSLDTALRSSKQ